MAGTTTKSAEELVQAYNKAMSSGLGAMDAGMAQTTAAVKLITDAVQAERTEFSKVWEKAADQSRERTENLTALFPTVFQGLATTPTAGIPAMSPGAKESVGKLIESEMAFYQAWTRAWMQYIAGVEERRSAAAKALLDSNAKTMESGQETIKHAVKYSEAFIDWSLETVSGKKTQEE